MGFGAWLIFGLLAGLVAHIFVPVKGTGGGCRGIIVTAVIGMAGAAVGGFIGTALGLGDVTGFDFRSFALAVAGAIIVLLAFRAISQN